MSCRATTRDDIYVNYWELDYRRLFRAWQDQFDFRAEEAGLHEYAVDGWTSNQVAIWDISDPSQPRRLTVTKGMAHKIYLPLISSRWRSSDTGPSGAFSDR